MAVQEMRQNSHTACGMLAEGRQMTIWKDVCQCVCVLGVKLGLMIGPIIQAENRGH